MTFIPTYHPKIFLGPEPLQGPVGSGGHVPCRAPLESTNPRFLIPGLGVREVLTKALQLSRGLT